MEAEILCDSLFDWLENREECAEELVELARVLEDVHEDSNITQAAAAATTVASLCGALIATALTGGLASPFLVAATTGTLVSGASTLAEAGMSNRIFNKATGLMKEDEKVEMRIQKQLRDLKYRCGGALKDGCGEAPNADELDCEVVTRLMWALARRRDTPVPLDFLRDFNRAMFFRHMTPDGLAPAEASRFICQALGLDCVSTSVMTTSLKVSAQVMMNNIGCIGFKAAAKAGSQALGVIGLGISMYDLIVKSKALVKGNRVTEASKILRDSAREIRVGQQKLKEQLDEMDEIIQKFFIMKNLIKNLGGYSLSMTDNAKKIMNYIMVTCTDDTVLSWLQTNQIEFVNLLRYYLQRLNHVLPDLSEPSGGHIDIVIVAHGRIVDQFMPSAVLVPTPNIRDTILYSPWNCVMHYKAAAAIAQGFIQVTDREFVNMADCEPNPLPDHWNNMRRSLHNIPGILLSPVTKEQEAWKLFNLFLVNRRGMEKEGRIIIPYLVPQEEVKAFGEIPLYIFIFVISFILMLSNKTATVHLVACLGRGRSPARPVQWRRQYAYTSDGTTMTVNRMYIYNDLIRALRSMFDRNRR